MVGYSYLRRWIMFHISKKQIFAAILMSCVCSSVQPAKYLNKIKEFYAESEDPRIKIIEQLKQKYETTKNSTQALIDALENLQERVEELAYQQNIQITQNELNKISQEKLKKNAQREKDYNDAYEQYYNNVNSEKKDASEDDSSSEDSDALSEKNDDSDEESNGAGVGGIPEDKKNNKNQVVDLTQLIDDVVVQGNENEEQPTASQIIMQQLQQGNDAISTKMANDAKTLIAALQTDEETSLQDQITALLTKMIKKAKEKINASKATYKNAQEALNKAYIQNALQFLKRKGIKYGKYALTAEAASLILCGVCTFAGFPVLASVFNPINHIKLPFWIAGCVLNTTYVPFSSAYNQLVGENEELVAEIEELNEEVKAYDCYNTCVEKSGKQHKILVNKDEITDSSGVYIDSEGKEIIIPDEIQGNEVALLSDFENNVAYEMTPCTAGEVVPFADCLKQECHPNYIKVMEHLNKYDLNNLIKQNG